MYVCMYVVLKARQDRAQQARTVHWMGGRQPRYIHTYTYEYIYTHTYIHTYIAHDGREEALHAGRVLHRYDIKVFYIRKFSSVV